MIKKRADPIFLFLTVAFIATLSILQISLVYAAENTSSAEGLDKAYSCLENLVKETGYSKLTSEEQAFALLALGYDSTIQGELRTALASSSNDNRCWPSDNCKLKSTALALISLKNINQATNLVENWLLEKTTKPSDLNWYLQIDTSEKASCTISYESGSKKVTVNEDKTISGAGGTCFKTANNGYWLEVDDDCYNKEFDISCDKEFVTSLLYKRKSTLSNLPYYISAVTNSAPAKSSTKEKINALCFKQGSSSSCNYEGSLWAALALKKAGKDVSSYLPYLIALASENKKYLPSSFLFMLTGDEEYFAELGNEQNIQGYWQVSGDANKLYYDTALALLSLQGRSATQADSAINYLLDKQPSSGCWNNARDTSFILYAAASKNPALSSSRVDCEDSNFFCVSSEDTCTEAKGEIKSNYYCPSLGKSACCSVKVEEELGPTTPSETETTACEELDYSCKSTCSSDEEVKPYECSGIQDCCGKKITTQTSSKWWLWLLIILIILLALAILFRNQLRVWIFRSKNRFTKGPAPLQTRPMPPRPPFGQLRQFRSMPGRFIPIRPGVPSRQIAGRPFPKENQLQEALRKLKEIGK